MVRCGIWRGSVGVGDVRGLFVLEVVHVVRVLPMLVVGEVVVARNGRVGGNISLGCCDVMVRDACVRVALGCVVDVFAVVGVVGVRAVGSSGSGSSPWFGVVQHVLGSVSEYLGRRNLQIVACKVRAAASSNAGGCK